MVQLSGFQQSLLRAASNPEGTGHAMGSSMQTVLLYSLTSRGCMEMLLQLETWEESGEAPGCPHKRTEARAKETQIMNSVYPGAWL